MPKSCAARQCCNRYSSRKKQLTFHRFPFSRPELLKEWVLNIGRGNFKPKQHTVICSEHFKPDCFSAFGNRKNLKQNAVPTVFAFQETAQDFSAAGAGEYTPERKMENPLDKHQLSSDAEASENEASSYRTEEIASRLLPTSSPGQRGPLPLPASDHSYALLDLDALKKKLVLTLKENERLRRRLKMQRMAMRRMSSRLQALQEGKRRQKALQREEERPVA
ncbi:THAP domain-containing protein 3 isoform X2 [Dromiciops gliroides]|uniref:THAP domain-containing protein 3 isoform X2 n=1 Tax=Dromiciops gliroides TaxID=33562 RepID=UPI001CC378FB|nr:THAP domain-containing protein 3 isoform X2 [Dromiciops gliroides]